LFICLLLLLSRGGISLDGLLNRSTGLARGDGLAGLLSVLGEQLAVLSLILLGLDSLLLLEGVEATAALLTLGGHETLDVRRLGCALLGSLGLALLCLLLLDDAATDDVLAGVVLLVEVEHLADLVGTLGSEALGLEVIRDSVDLGLAALDDDQIEDGNIGSDDAAADGLATTLAIETLGNVATRVLVQEKAHTLLLEHTLHHGEALLVRATLDLDDVAGELGANAVKCNLGAHTEIVEAASTDLLLNVDGLLASRGRIREIELHPLFDLFTFLFFSRQITSKNNQKAKDRC